MSWLILDFYVMLCFLNNEFSCIHDKMACVKLSLKKRCEAKRKQWNNLNPRQDLNLQFLTNCILLLFLARFINAAMPIYVTNHNCVHKYWALTLKMLYEHDFLFFRSLTFFYSPKTTNYFKSNSIFHAIQSISIVPRFFTVTFITHLWQPRASAVPNYSPRMRAVITKEVHYGTLACLALADTPIHRFTMTVINVWYHTKVCMVQSTTEVKQMFI